jgi:hypothetical protein
MLSQTTDFDIPFSSDDAVIEYEAIDPEAGEPEEWPAWTDEFWYEPTQEDVEFLNRNAYGYEPTPEDLEEMAQWSEHLSRLDDIQSQEDAAYEAYLRYNRTV